MYSNSLNQEVGKRIYSRRKSLGITQEQLAELTDTTPQAISNYERGVRELRATAIIEIAQALDTDCEFLLTGKIQSVLGTEKITNEKQALKTIKEILKLIK